MEGEVRAFSVPSESNDQVFNSQSELQRLSMGKWFTLVSVKMGQEDRVQEQGKEVP